MNPTHSVIRPTAWLSIIPQMIVIAIVIMLAHIVKLPEPLFTGALIYLTLSVLLRQIIPSAHNKGMRLVKTNEFEAAIPHFKESYTFFSKYDWVDEFRYLTLLSSSAISYREMALLNLGFCHNRIGDLGHAREYFQQTIREFPKSYLAMAALKKIDASQLK